MLSSALYSQGNETAENTGQNNQNTGAESTPLPSGYGDAVWGSYLTDVKDKISGRLAYTDDKTIIISRDGDLEYHYGFFYKDPLITGEEARPASDTENTAGNADEAAAGEEVKDEGKLFYVSLKFPYLDKDLVYNKIKEKYGLHSSEDIKNNQGAMAWNSDKTVILMWIDRYEDKPYCRRIVYVSKEISAQLNEYHYTIFNKREIELIKQLTP
jgi:hypothetical protein